MALPLERTPPRPPQLRPPARGAARLLWGAPLDLNREDAEVFEALAGIGPKRGAAIAAGRPFCRVSDLDRVPGIGPRTLLRLRGQIAVLDPPEACAASGALMK
jgi:competence protein ComEA